VTHLVCPQDEDHEECVEEAVGKDPRAQERPARDVRSYFGPRPGPGHRQGDERRREQNDVKSRSRVGRGRIEREGLHGAAGV
jgi:hypothetical protein